MDWMEPSTHPIRFGFIWEWKLVQNYWKWIPRWMIKLKIYRSFGEVQNKTMKVFRLRVDNIMWRSMISNITDSQHTTRLGFASSHHHGILFLPKPYSKQQLRSELDECPLWKKPSPHITSQLNAPFFLIWLLPLSLSLSVQILLPSKP